ncbi:hypothetical protein EJ110_NYTH46987 [Nymphaea thermarum]|nr:hypothetical protein EJ110_NYTH46987 [Nymphaea thermarum]
MSQASTLGFEEKNDDSGRLSPLREYLTTPKATTRLHRFGGKVDPLSVTQKPVAGLTGTKYDAKYRHKLVKDKLGDTKLQQTLTNVVIPTFDIKYHALT